MCMLCTPVDRAVDRPSPPVDRAVDRELVWPASMRRLAPLSSDLCATFFHLLYLLSPYRVGIFTTQISLGDQISKTNREKPKFFLQNQIHIQQGDLNNSQQCHCRKDGGEVARSGIKVCSIWDMGSCLFFTQRLHTTTTRQLRILREAAAAWQRMLKTTTQVEGEKKYILAHLVTCFFKYHTFCMPSNCFGHMFWCDLVWFTSRSHLRFYLHM